MLTLTAVIRKDEDMYVAECLEAGTASQGKTIEEAAANIKEATEQSRRGSMTGRTRSLPFWPSQIGKRRSQECWMASRLTSLWPAAGRDLLPGGPGILSIPMRGRGRESCCAAGPSAVPSRICPRSQARAGLQAECSREKIPWLLATKTKDSEGYLVAGRKTHPRIMAMS